MSDEEEHDPSLLDLAAALRGPFEAKATPPRRWGAWYYDGISFALELTLPNPHHSYQVDLAGIIRADDVLGRTYTLLGKSWATDKIVADLLRALDDLITPQSTLRDGATIDPRATVSLRYPVLSKQDEDDIERLAQGMLGIEATSEVREAMQRLIADGPNLNDVLLLCERFLNGEEFNEPHYYELRQPATRLVNRYHPASHS